MPSVYRPLVNFVAKAMQAVLNLALLCLGIILVVFLGKETLHSGARTVYAGAGE